MADLIIGIILIAAVAAVIWKKRRDKKMGKMRRMLRQLWDRVPSEKRQGRWGGQTPRCEMTAAEMNAI